MEGPDPGPSICLCQEITVYKSLVRIRINRKIKFKIISTNGLALSRTRWELVAAVADGIGTELRGRGTLVSRPIRRSGPQGGGDQA